MQVVSYFYALYKKIHNFLKRRVCPTTYSFTRFSLHQTRYSTCLHRTSLRASLMGPSTVPANGSWRARGSKWGPTATPYHPHYFWASPHLARSRQLFAFCRETFSARHQAVNATMATLEAGKAGKKGKNFSADEERALCRSFLVVSQDPVCGNGQRNTAFWERITANYNANKPKSCPIRPARSLESKWSHIKHDVAKFKWCIQTSFRL